MLVSTVETTISKRILVVEDAPCIADLLSAVLSEAGYDVVGTADTPAKAIALTAASHVDVALLDINLRGTPSYPVADYLAGQGVRFAFLTAAEPDNMPPHLEVHPIIQKPVALWHLFETLDQLLER